MKATLTGNKREGQRVLLEAESPEECVALAYQPDLELIQETRGHRIFLELRYKIVPTHRSESFFSKELGEDWDHDRKIRHLHGEYGQLKLKHVVLEEDLAKAKRQEQWVVDEGLKRITALEEELGRAMREISAANHVIEVEKARLGKLVRACQSRKVGEQWPAIDHVIKSFGKVEHT